jgi:hypothetical protein
MARRARKHRVEEKPQAQRKHPDRSGDDLNPDRLQGQNVGPSPAEDSNARTAAQIKEVTELLPNFRNDELREIPIVPRGSRLKQGAVYLDLRKPASGSFQTTGEMTAGPENLYVPKAEVAYEYWNRLIETLCPDRTDTSAEAKFGEPRAEERESPEAKPSEENMDKTLADSFPASDPPSWTTGREK